ncbi:MAG: rhomboid family intramembrane serine protease, partial [Methylocella sp.]
MRSNKERIFNLPPVVLWLIALFAAIEGLANLLSPEAYLEFLRRFAFVPGRFTFAFDPDRVSLAVNSITDDAG